MNSIQTSEQEQFNYLSQQDIDSLQSFLDDDEFQLESFKKVCDILNDVAEIPPDLSDFFNQVKNHAISIASNQLPTLSSIISDLEDKLDHYNATAESRDYNSSSDNDDDESNHSDDDDDYYNNHYDNEDDDGNDDYDMNNYDEFDEDDNSNYTNIDSTINAITEKINQHKQQFYLIKNCFQNLRDIEF